MDNDKLRESSRMISINDLIDAYASYRVISDENGQPVDAVIIDMNNEGERIFGKTRSESVGKRISEVFSSESVTNWITLYKFIKENGISTNCSFYSCFADRQFNTRVFIEDENVNIIYHDVSDLYDARVRYSETEEKYRCLVDQSVDGIFVTDRQGRVVEFNRVMENITGIKSEDIIGRPLTDLFKYVRIDNYELIDAQYNQIGRFYELSGTDWDKANGKIIDAVIIRQDNTTRSIQCMIYGFKTSKDFYKCSIIWDVTETKRLEELKSIIEDRERKLKEALELERLRSEFFSNLSHEFRTPLNIIFGCIQLMSGYIHEKACTCDSSGNMTRNLKSARQNCYRLLRLINNLIDVTKIDAGFYELNPVKCNIVKVIEDISLSVADYMKQRNIELVFDTEVEEKIMTCDPDMIERIMLNMLSNAIKFTDKSGRIIVNIYDNGDYISVSVEDTGIGIPEEKIGCIFQRFRQVDNSLTRMYEGSGIGLSLVRSLVEMHGGTITVQSIVGKGTRFNIILPVNLLKPSEKGDAAARNLNDNSHVEKINIEFADIYV